VDVVRGDLGWPDHSLVAPVLLDRRREHAARPDPVRAHHDRLLDPVLADETLRDGQFVSGANRTGWHLRGVEAGRDFQAEFADIRQPKEGDACPVCGGLLGFQTAIEVGHIFKLGTKYSEAFNAKYVDEDGIEKPIVMGSYGIGPGRVLAAAVEQHGHDEGMVWPAEIAPYDVHVVVLGWDNPEIVSIGEQVAESLSAEGLDVLLDDRELRPGEKFADADLIGCPIRVTVGKKTLEDGAVDLKFRDSGKEERVASLEIEKRVVAR